MYILSFRSERNNCGGPDPGWSFLCIFVYLNLLVVAATKGTTQASAPVGSSSTSEMQRPVAKRTKPSTVSKPSKIAKIKDPGVRRSHPGMTLANDRSTAHHGSVTALQTSDDGLNLFSAGRSSRTIFSTALRLSFLRGHNSPWWGP